jgi:integral membrane protein
MNALAVLPAYVLWRIVKFLGLVVLAGGIAGSILSTERRQRLALTYAYAVPGFVITWSAGWMLMKASDRALTEPWILTGAAASLLSLHAAFLASHLERPRAVTPLLAAGGLMASVFIMVVRTNDISSLLGLTLAGVLVGAFAARPAVHLAVTASAADAALVRRGFRWIAWAEGGTLLVLLGVSMPLKYGLGVVLDGGTGLIGWVHGVFVIVYLQALVSTARFVGWSWKPQLIGFVAALLPAGAFVFERWVGRDAEPVRAQGPHQSRS